MSPSIPTEPAAMHKTNDTTSGKEEPKRRPRLNLGSALGEGKERKKGKSVFGILLGTLNKAKSEDRERGASEAVSLSSLVSQNRTLTISAFVGQKASFN